MSEDNSTSKSEIDGLFVLKKDLNNFEVGSNLEEARSMNFICNSVDWLLERKDE